MRILYERCCGLDIHKVSIAVCVVITRDGKTEQETRRFGTMTADLLELAAWLNIRNLFKRLVGLPGFEPGTSCTPSKKYQSLTSALQ